MSVEAELSGLSPKKGMLLTIGVFDGVHLGHKHILSELVEQAKRKNLISGVITFKQHPQRLLEPHSILPFLTNLPQKIKLLKDEGVEVVITLSFTLELAQTGAYQFISLLQKYLSMRGLVLGPDFTLGRNQEGNADALRTLSKCINFSLTVVPQIKINGDVVSSTAIRSALANGDIKKANVMLDRYFSLEGHVITGTGRGTDLGFPTANLDIEPERALPADGIYATWAYINNQRYQSVTNIGKRPTFGEGEQTVEVYILDFQGNLYRHEIKIDIIERLRREEKFNTIEELKKQIEEDIKQARAILNRSSRE
jgi:riboflavin kinase/FMN adenylyltransferase